jgi:hypothetical protein
VPLETIGMVGDGVKGRGVAQVLAEIGHQVILVDLTAELLDARVVTAYWQEEKLWTGCCYYRPPGTAGCLAEACPYCLTILPHVSRRPTVRLKTGRPGSEWIGSTKK